MSANNALVAFVRNPELGKVKTRVAKGSSDEKALEVYKNLLEILRNNILELPYDKYIYYADAVHENDIWDKDKFTKKLQHQLDLGNRMYTTFADLFEEGKDNIVITGSDCPYLKSSHISQAFDALKNHDAVIGPANDGGYYLIGLSKLNKHIFQDIAWSTETVFEQTLKKMKENNMSFTVLEPLSDIDHIEDWEAYLGSV